MLRTTAIPRLLDETYRRRAIAPGTARFWSWLFAAPDSRAPLLGIYALLAEWRALMDPGTEAGAAQIKLAWWEEEVRRLAAGRPVHPVSCYLAALPRAPQADFTQLNAAIMATAAQIAGVPIERGAALEAHAYSLLGCPLLVGAQLAGERCAGTHLRVCASALSAADYLARAIAGYRRDARSGRMPFAIDELLAAGIENADLLAIEPPSHLQRYLAELRDRTAGYYALAQRTLPREERPQNRHLLVLAALGLRLFAERRPPNAVAARGLVYPAARAARPPAAGK
jgi:15-cis-phytoene synthase